MTEAEHYISPRVVLWCGRAYPTREAAEEQAAQMNASLCSYEVLVGNHIAGTAIGWAVTEKPGWLIERQCEH